MSVAGDIKAAATTAITALALTGSPAVVAAKTPILPSGKTPPAVRVACSRGGKCEPYDATRVVVTYTLTVGMYTSTTGETGDDDTIDTWREAVNKAIDDRSTFASVSGFNEVFREEGTPYSAAGFDSGFNVSFLSFRCEVIEDRN